MLPAIVFVVAPEPWMASIHAVLDLGELPTAPIVGYLARSTSAFYAMFGGLLIVTSFDFQRYRTLLVYLGWVTSSFGVVLLGIDWFENMPLSWTLSEGPFVLIFGLAILSLSIRIETT